MIFLPNKNKHKQHHGSHHGSSSHHMTNPDINKQIQMAVVHNQNPQLTRQQITEIRRQQASHNEQKKREKMKDTILKILAFIGSIFLLAGIGLLIFGIVQSQLFGYVTGAVLLAVGILLLGIMIYLMCKDEERKLNEIEMQNSSSRITQVTPNY